MCFYPLPTPCLWILPFCFLWLGTWIFSVPRHTVFYLVSAHILMQIFPLPGVHPHSLPALPSNLYSLVFPPSPPLPPLFALLIFQITSLAKHIGKALYDPQAFCASVSWHSPYGLAVPCLASVFTSMWSKGRGRIIWSPLYHTNHSACRRVSAQ